MYTRARQARNVIYSKALSRFGREERHKCLTSHSSEHESDASSVSTTASSKYDCSVSRGVKEVAQVPPKGLVKRNNTNREWQTSHTHISLETTKRLRRLQKRKAMIHQTDVSRKQYQCQRVAAVRWLAKHQRTTDKLGSAIVREIELFEITTLLHLIEYAEP